MKLIESLKSSDTGKKNPELDAEINRVSNISNAIVEAANKAQPKVIQLSGPYISRISETKFKAEDLIGDPALLQIELPEGHYFADGTSSKNLTFSVKKPGVVDEIKLEIMNDDGILVDKINYQLLWAS